MQSHPLMYLEEPMQSSCSDVFKEVRRGYAVKIEMSMAHTV